MASLVHEPGWWNALFFLLVACVSLISMLKLLRQAGKERDRRIREEMNQGLRAGDDVDPVNVLKRKESGRSSLAPAYLLIGANGLVFVASLLLGMPAIKSAMYAHRAGAAFGEHNYEDAAKLYQSAMDSNATASYLNTRYQDSLAQSDSKGGDLGRARRYVTLHPGDEGHHNDLGNLLSQKGDLDGAIREYKLAVSIQPDDPIVHNNLGNALQAAHRYPESIAELRRALELNPNQAPTYYNLANTLFANNQTEEAVTAYRTAIEHNPKLAPAYYNLAQALARQGKRDQAMTTMDTFLQLADKQPEFAGVVGKARQQIIDWRKVH